MATNAQIDKSWYERVSGMPFQHAAGGVILRCTKKKGVQVALVTEKGLTHYFLPKGRLDKGESDEQAARREILEEAGFKELKLVADLGLAERMNFKKTIWKSTHYFLFLTSEKKPKPTDKNHDYVVSWFTLDNKLPDILWPEQKQLLIRVRKMVNKGKIGIDIA